MPKTPIALLQLTTSNHMADNVAAVVGLIAKAAKKGAVMVFTPETTHLMETNAKDVLNKAFSQDEDPGLKAFQQAAKTDKIWVHIGSLIIKTSTDRLVNRAFVINDKGEIVATYDKLHLFDVQLEGGESYTESKLYDAGNQAAIVTTPLGAMGLSICYDLRFPYLYRLLAEKGATTLVVPAAFTKQTGKAHWHTLLKARAIENGAFVIAAAQGGAHSNGRETYGHSLVVGPWGDILLDGGDTYGLHMVDIDLTDVEKARAKIPSLSHGKFIDFKRF